MNLHSRDTQGDVDVLVFVLEEPGDEQAPVHFTCVCNNEGTWCSKRTYHDVNRDRTLCLKSRYEDRCHSSHSRTVSAAKNTFSFS